MDQSIINFKVYEDSVEYVGMAQATLPDLTALTRVHLWRRHRRQCGGGHSRPLRRYDAGP
ncbi:MAG: phage major tail tube protein [Oscillospiraceae bacterium]